MKEDLGDWGWRGPPPTWERGKHTLGRVTAVERREWQVITTDGPSVAVGAGRLYQRDRTAGPVVGDWVRLEAGRDRHRIVEQLPRSSWLSRRVAGRGARQRGRTQTLCANVDRAFVVTAAGGDFNPRRVERFLAMAEEGQVPATVLLNKADRSENPNADVKALRGVAPGHPVEAIEALRPAAEVTLRRHAEPGQTVVFVGSSGVGKSTLVNRLLAHDRQRTGAVRADDDKGRHVTTQRQLFRSPEGIIVIDTPGIREVGLLAATLDETFADVTELALGCRFRDCRHEQEPDCAVRSAVEIGTLDPKRLRAYLALRREAQ
jgi:ribosome biogenesis GTPase